MPDKWGYPWYAAWDLAFHVIAPTLVDEDFGKQQLDLMRQGEAYSSTAQSLRQLARDGSHAEFPGS